MDRTALCLRAAATASLGALLSAGCGSDSVHSATCERMESPAVAKVTQAVVVSPAEEFREPLGYTATALNVETESESADAGRLISPVQMTDTVDVVDERAAEPLEELDAAEAETEQLAATAT